METENIQKNETSLKSVIMRKVEFLRKVCFALGVASFVFAGNSFSQTGKPGYITLIGDLNTDEPVINSHENDTGAKILELNYREYYEIQIPSPFNSASPIAPVYSRIKKLPNGKYIMFWQINDVGSNILYSTGLNLKDWETPKQIFIPIEGITVNVQGQPVTDKRTYNNGDALALRNGDLMAVAAFRANSNLYNTNDGDGIAMRISKDNGQTWGEEKVIFRGRNWEPQILQLQSGEIHVYFTHASTNDQIQFDNGIINPALIRSSGTALLRSTDNGETWISHLPENEFYGYVISQTYTGTESVAIPSGGTLNINRYTDQMPCAVELNNSGAIALALEDQRPDYSSAMDISVAHSDDDWAHNFSPNSIVGIENVEQGPADKEVICQGSAPYLKQFPSGETVLSYNIGNVYSLRLGDSQARNFGQMYQPFKYQGYWGALELDGSHTVIGTVTTGQITTDFNLPGANRHILIGKFYLNHTIFPARSTPTIDGNNEDWVNNADALFVGGESQAQAAVRMAYDDDNLYLLVERTDYDLLPSDRMDVYLHAGTGTLDSSSLRLRIGTDGVQQVFRYSGKNWADAQAPEIQSETLVLGTVSNSSDSDEGYIAEVVIPRSTIQASGSQVKIAFVLYNQDNGTAMIGDMLNGIDLNQPDGWLRAEIQKATAGIKIPDTSMARIFSNPTDGIITLNFETAGEYRISLSDMRGKTLLRQDFSGSTARIDIRNYPSSVYLLTINDGKRQKTVRVIKN
ncbi:MAG: T9SS type A sorting domain-containing protein [Candidatus Azobacteroides sp.]|nr:T9SS type A sorting domain-containing protein [Candidatus Azobacteroides sp.]